MPRGQSYEDLRAFQSKFKWLSGLVGAVTGSLATFVFGLSPEHQYRGLATARAGFISVIVALVMFLLVAGKSRKTRLKSLWISLGLFSAVVMTYGILFVLYTD